MNVVLTVNIIQSYLEWMSLEQNAKPKTITTYRKRITYLMNYLSGKPFMFENCRAYLLYLRQNGQSNASLAISACAIRSLCLYFSTINKTFVNFGKSIPNIKVKAPLIDVLSVGEIEKILTAPRVYRYEGLKEFWDLFLSLLARTGRRVTELSTLKISDLDVSRSAIFLRDPKGEPQILPIPQDITLQLQERCKGKDPQSYIFTHKYCESGKPISTVSIRNELNARARMVGITKRVYPHLLRHCFPIELLRMKVPLPEVSRLMGHKKIETTMRYVHMVLDDLQIASGNHPLNQANLTVIEIIKNIEHELDRYRLMKRTDLEFEISHSNHEFHFGVKW